MKQEKNTEKEGDKQFKKGKEALTTGVFQWKKDYTQGAMYFEEAAKIYKECKNAQKEKASLLMAIECNEKLNDTWAMGRNYEALINTYVDNSSEEYPEILNNTIKAGQFFKVSDSGNKAISVFSSVAKYLIKKKQFDTAEQVIKMAMDEAEEQQLPSTRSDIVSLYIELLMETQQYYKAVDVYKKEIEKHKEEYQKYPLHQWAMIIIILLILQDEIIRASSELEQLIISVYNFHKSSEFKAVDLMLNAYEKGDQKQFDDAVMRPIVTNIYPPSIVRVLRKQKVRVIQFHQKQNLNQIDNEQQQQNDYQTELEKKIL